MLGFRLFLHALRMILGNFSAAVRISTPIIVMAVVLGWMSVGIASHPDAVRMPGGGVQIPFEAVSARFGVSFLIALLLAIVGFLWTAVAWHRYTLLEEVPGALMPRWNGGAIRAYLVAGIVLVLLLFAAALVLGIVGGLLSVTLAQAGLPAMAVAMVFGAVVYVPAVIISYRIAAILPAAAVGRKIGVGDAWRATRGATGALLVLAIITVVFSLAAGAPVAALTRIALPLGLIWQALINWLGMLLGISILTTIYGHFVEKRDLNA